MSIDLPLARYHLQFTLEDSLQLPQHMGSLWHSVLGRALRKLACITRNPECKDCLFLHQCDYPYLFNRVPPQDSDIMRKYTTIPVPHVLRPIATNHTQLHPNDTLSLELILMGNANNKLPILIGAFHTLGQWGLGKTRSRLHLQQVTQHNPSGEQKALWIDGKLVTSLLPESVPIPAVPETVQVNLLTPYKPSSKHTDKQCIDVGRYLMAIIRRIDLLQYFYHGHKLTVDFQALKALTLSIPVKEQLLQYQRSQRFSSRMRQSKDTSGFTGHLSLDLREHEALWPFLYLGQWLNVGKNASMGFGRYQLSVPL